MSTDTPDVHGAHPRLTDEQVELLAPSGERRPTAAGEVLFREGEPHQEFLVVLSGLVDVVHDFGLPEEALVATHGPGRFLGELGLLEGLRAFYTAVVREAGEVLAVSVDHLREVIANDPALGDQVLRAYLGRRTRLIGIGAGFRILGSHHSPQTGRLREFAARNRLPHRLVDLESDDEAEALLRRLGITPQDTPVVIWDGRQVLRDPDTADLARLVGLPTPSGSASVHDLLVVGSGPAGLAAAVYGASDGYSTALIDAVATGGQAARTSRIENYLGFPSGISGGELIERAVLQAHKFDADILVPAEAQALRCEGDHYTAALADGTNAAGRTVVLTTGVRYRRLVVPGSEHFEGSSIHYAATAHEARMCGQEPVAVVGGGNSAGQAAVFLADNGSRVHIVAIDDSLEQNMSRYLIDQIKQRPGIEVHLKQEVAEVTGDDRIRQVRVRDLRTRHGSDLEVRALFVFIGAHPCTDWLGKTLVLDDHGFIVTGSEPGDTADQGPWQQLEREPLPLETNWPGIFAAGDVRSGSVKRVASAVGEGAMSVRLAHEHLARTPTRATSTP
ncbi:FAD-dependent oxidoreductase [Streptomyces smyrnaeus]|uniref:FAD-dependent oxidoreductase n=1 Tax=Streptomyces smyrnaeus TaxID=1387713 RepID=UPI0033E386DB